MTDNDGCSTRTRGDGKTLFCNGGPAATASRSVRIDADVTGARVKARHKQRQRSRRHLAVKLKAGAAEAVTLKARGKVISGKAHTRLRKVGAEAAAGGLVRLKLKAGKRGSHKLLKRLAHGHKAKAKIRVRFEDAYGNKLGQRVKVKLK